MDRLHLIVGGGCILGHRKAAFRSSALVLGDKSVVARLSAQAWGFAVGNQRHSGDFPILGHAGHHVDRTAIALAGGFEHVADHLARRIKPGIHTVLLFGDGHLLKGSGRREHLLAGSLRRGGGSFCHNVFGDIVRACQQRRHHHADNGQRGGWTNDFLHHCRAPSSPNGTGRVSRSI